MGKGMGVANNRLLFAAAALLLAAVACENKAEKEHEAQLRAVDSMKALRAQGKTDLSNPEMGAKVLVRIYDDSIFQSHHEIPKGQVTFAVENKGTKPHDLKVSGPAGSWTSTPIAPQGYVLMSMILDKYGDYELAAKDVKIIGTLKVPNPVVQTVTQQPLPKKQ